MGIVKFNFRSIIFLALFLIVLKAYSQKPDTLQISEDRKCLVFENRKFNQILFLGSNKIDSVVKFNSCTIKDSIDFSNTIFKNSSCFTNCEFSESPNFKSNIDFEEINFLKGAKFIYSKFERPIDFGKTIFLNNLDFTESRINNYIDFTDAKILRQGGKGKSYLSFHNAVLDQKAILDFSSTTLPDFIDLSNMYNYGRDIDFLQSDFERRRKYFDSIGVDYQPIEICLYGTNISKIRLDYNNFKLSLPDSIYNFNGKLRKVSEDEKIGIFEFLLNNFKIHGQLESYKKLDIEYTDYKLGIFKFFKYWNYYGYHKELIFLWVIGLLIILTLITSFILSKINRPPDDNGAYFIENIPKKDSKLKKGIVFTFWNSLMYTSSIFFLINLNLNNLNFKNKFGVIYIISIYSIGLICLGYTANFIFNK